MTAAPRARSAALVSHSRRPFRGTRRVDGPGDSRSVRSQFGRGRISSVQARPFQRRILPGSWGSGYHAGGWDDRRTPPLYQPSGALCSGVPFPTVGALVVLAAQAGAIEPGAEAETVVLVRNTGEARDTFHVVVQGPAAGWAVVNPPSVTLDPETEAPVWVHFRPPRSPDTTPGRVPFDIAVAASGDSHFLAIEEGVLDIGTYSSVAASFSGEAVLGARWVEYDLCVRNTGNRRVKVSVEAEAVLPPGALEVEPQEIELVAGQAAEVRVRVRPPRRLLPRTANRSVTVSVVSDGGALATLRTQYPADPPLVDELFRSARVLLALLVLLFLGGLALLNSDPQPDSVDVFGGGRADLPSAPPPSEPPQEEPAEAPPSEASDAPGEPEPVVGAPRTSVPAPPPPLPRMVFVRVFDPSTSDLVIREPGSKGGELRLRTDGALESRPRLSPDGDHVAFVRGKDSTWRICVVGAGGGEAVCVADTSADAAVAWSPSGSELYFSRGGKLFSVPYDAGARTAGPEVDLGVAVPGGHFALSPDGSRVVVAEGSRLVQWNVDGSSSSTVEVPQPAQDPAFSPDGTRLVFTSAFQIFTVPSTGGPIRQLTTATTVNGEAAWTAEGDWVVFRSNRSGLGDLYCVKGDSAGGSERGLAQITATEQRETTASF